MEEKYLWTPNVSVGEFILWKPLTDYIKFNLEKIESDYFVDTLPASYRCNNPEISIDMDEDECICFIVCEKYLYYKDINLLRLNIKGLEKLLDTKADKTEVSPEDAEYIHYFSFLGLMVYSTERRILSISVTDRLF